MWNKLKNPFAFKPDALAVAFIDAIRKDYNRLGRGKWYDIRADVYNACDRHSKMWIDAEMKKIQKEKVMVELCALQLDTSEDTNNLDARGKAAKINAGLASIGAMNHSILSANQQAAYQQAQMNHSLAAHNYNTNAAPW